MRTVSATVYFYVRVQEKEEAENVVCCYCTFDIAYSCIFTFEGLKIDIDNRCITTENGVFELPPKEFDLLLFCAKNQGKILTKQQIYESVWGEEYVYDDSNIMAIISRLRKKLEVNPGKPKYIQTIKGIGYRFNKEV